MECEWLTLPGFKLRPNPKHNATVRMTASVIDYAVSSHNKATAELHETHKMQSLRLEETKRDDLW
jgi:hypothetical protein